MTKIKASSTNQMNKRVVATTCPVTFTLQKMGGRWKPLVLKQLLTGTKRYGELKKAIPAVSEKMLIQSLKELETDDIILRTATPVVPPQVEYRLTECGEELSPVFLAMVVWAKKYNV